MGQPGSSISPGMDSRTEAKTLVCKIILKLATAPTLSWPQIKSQP